MLWISRARKNFPYFSKAFLIMKIHDDEKMSPAFSLGIMSNVIAKHFNVASSSKKLVKMMNKISLSSSQTIFSWAIKFFSFASCLHVLPFPPPPLDVIFNFDNIFQLSFNFHHIFRRQRWWWLKIHKASVILIKMIFISNVLTLFSFVHGKFEDEIDLSSNSKRKTNGWERN